VSEHRAWLSIGQCLRTRSGSSEVSGRSYRGRKSRRQSSQLWRFDSLRRALGSTTKERSMGLTDKAKDKTEELKGKAKETAGKATDNKDLEAKGKSDQAKANLKQAGEKVKDAVKK
jgi:uncharacterized protein YjbJ (UPF0337 family)